MQQLLVLFTEILSTIDIDMEIMIFISSVMLFFFMQSLRKSYMATNFTKRTTVCEKGIAEKPAEEDANESTSCKQNARHAQIDKALQAAFEAEDYWQVLECWNALKRFRECPPIHISQIVKSMQCCNQGARVIVAELRNYFKTYSKKRDISVVNDILEPLARRLDDSELVNSIVSMLPSIYLTKDSRTYEILLTMYVAQHNMTKAQDVIAEMRKHKVAFTPCATVAVMTIALQLKDFDIALKAFSTLQAFWDVRSTWAVSPFALQRHKNNIVAQIVDLARQKHKLREVLSILEGMAVPEAVVNAVHAEVQMEKIQYSGKARARIYSEASTSEGSRSDSDGEDKDTSFVGVRPPAFTIHQTTSARLRSAPGL